MRMNLGRVSGKRSEKNWTQEMGWKPRETLGNKGGETRGGARIGSWKENVERQETEAETAKEREIDQESENDKGRA